MFWLQLQWLCYCGPWICSVFSVSDRLISRVSPWWVFEISSPGCLTQKWPRRCRGTRLTMTFGGRPSSPVLYSPGRETAALQVNPADVPALEIKLGALVVLLSVTLLFGMAPLCIVRGAGRCSVDPGEEPGETCLWRGESFRETKEPEPVGSWACWPRSSMLKSQMCTYKLSQKHITQVQVLITQHNFEYLLTKVISCTCCLHITALCFICSHQLTVLELFDCTWYKPGENRNKVSLLMTCTYCSYS